MNQKFKSQKKKQIRWDQQFRRQIYLKNYNNFKKINKLNIEDEKLKDSVVCQFIKNYPHQIIFSQNNDEQVQNIEGNCIYFPLKRNAQFDDQFVNTFPYVKNLKEKGIFHQKNNIYNAVFAFIRQCKNQSNMQKGWQLCLKRFLPSIDIIKKIQIFMQALKHGEHQINKYHKIFNSSCLQNIFRNAILQTHKFYHHQRKINKTLKLSIEMHEQMNQINMPKTNKTLYCSICYLYDCGKHKLQQTSQQKNYCYVHPKNIISPQQHIYKAIKLCEFKNLLGKIQLQQPPCSNQCYKIIKLYQIQQVKLLKMNILNPATIGLIQMGIQLFSYEPCKICRLFPRQAKYGRNLVTCSLIFFYFLEEYNIISRLEHKFFKNEKQFLLNQAVYDQNDKIFSKKKRKKKQIDFHINSACFHHYQFQQSFDLACQNCNCNERGFCLPQCICSKNCTLMMKGCNCKGKESCKSKKCICFNQKRQCLPQLCRNCFSGENIKKKNNCKNNQLLLNLSKKIRVGKSTIKKAGFGAFAGQQIKQGDLVQVYAGQLIQPELQNIRQLIKKDETFYNFAFSDQSIDARYFGNKCRFINHGNQIQEKANLLSLTMYSQGQQYIGLYARKDILEGQQLFFDYDVQGNLGKSHLQKYPFLRKEKC